MRILALILGIVGVVIAFIINLLYSSLHTLGRISGISNDQTHFFWGLIVTFIGLIGSLFALFFPSGAVVLLLVAGIAFFFIAGWWALLASPFLLIAAFLAYRSSKVQRQVGV
jgi:tetrahydromethanopterin S-methyltransferase subunit E